MFLKLFFEPRNYRVGFIYKISMKCLLDNMWRRRFGFAITSLELFSN